MASWGLLEKLASLTVTGRRRLQDERAELEWLRRTLPRLRATVRDAERRQIKDEGVVLWLQEIKDVVCDGEDVIDEFEYEELRRKVKGRRGHTGGSSRSLLPRPNQAMVHKIYEIRQRLDDMANPSRWSDQYCTQRRMIQTSSLLQEGEVFGREKEKEEILEFLLTSNDEIAPSTVAIPGMGGLGKTTLAQLVYNDKRVEKHFKLKMWVCITADYDIVKLTREILVSAGYYMQFSHDIENLDVHQRKLVEILKGKRFSLVIDNLWDRDHRMWQNLYVPLIHGEKGSKVLITTRDRKVSRIFQARMIVELEGLQFHDCWMLFKKRAFVDGNSGDYPGLEVIGKQMVEKFKGVPLAAVTVGGLLHSELEENEWIRILESKVWEEHGEDGILSVLKLSYDYLPPQLKQCYAYCSLFPKNHKFDKLELIQQWMAQGFISTGERERMEDVGTDYFNDLFNRSFFQFVDGKFVIHDLIHDLAEFISQHDHSIIDIDGSHENLEAARKLRYLSLLMPCGQPNRRTLEALCRYRGLRTLAFYFPRDSNFHIPHNLFLSLNTLRVLDLSCGNIDKLPDSISHLKHLQYLDLRRNTFRNLPESLCCLYKLQTLKLRDCHHINRLPQGISKLISLRHLEVAPYLLSEVIGIGMLTCLQELESFPISKGHGIKIEDLKDLNELRGTLSIMNLGRVTSKEEAMQAVLNNKRYLHKLETNWDEFAGRGNSKLEEEILEALVPPPNLKELSIRSYDGIQFPSWMEHQSTSKLQSLCLCHCRNLNSPPQLWCLPFIQTIEIVDCPQLSDLPSLPTTTRELTIDNIGLEELPDFYQPSQPISGSCDNIRPSLSILSINRCPALKSLQQGLLRHHLRNLTGLRIQNCEQVVHWPEEAGFRATVLSLQGELYLRNCPKLMAFPPGSTLSASLKAFTVIGCPGVPNGLLFAQLHNLSSESVVHVEKAYMNLERCFQEALQNLRTVDWLLIDEVWDDKYLILDQFQDGQLLSLVCRRERMWSWRHNGWVLVWQVQIDLRRNRRKLLYAQELSGRPFCFVAPEEWWQRRSRPAIGKRAVVHDDDDHHHYSLFSACLGEHHLPWASSIRWLVANGDLHGAFLSSNLTSLEGLWISHCRGTRPLLTDVQLTYLTGLRELQISDCPEMTMSSLQEVIRSLPSLQHLTIKACPKLSSSFSSCSSPSPVEILGPNVATLQTLFVDDPRLLGDAQFVHDHLSSLRGLHIWHGDFTSFTAAMEEGLQGLGQSLQHLSCKSCPNLQHLPSDFRSLLPLLKALSIGECPKLQCLPTGGLPTLLDILVVHDCGRLQGRCKPPPPAGQEVQQQTDWPKMAHIPVMVNNGDLVKGTYREFLELRAKWRDF